MAVGKNLFVFNDKKFQVFPLGVPHYIIYEEGGTDSKLGTIEIKKATGGGNGQDDTKFLQTCIVNSIPYNREVACQVEPTLGGNVYVSYFGDKPTVYTVEGVAFDGYNCDENYGSASGNGTKLTYNNGMPAVENVTDDVGDTWDGLRKENVVKNIVDFYDKYKLQNSDSTSKDATDQVTLTTYNTIFGGSITYVGLLVGMTLRLAAAVNGIRQYTFSYNFIAIK